MGFPGIDEIRARFDLLPTLAEADVDRAVKAAGKPLLESRRELLHANLNVAFRNYFTNRLWDLWAAKAPASRTAAKLKRIAAAADKLANLLELSDKPNESQQRGRINELYRLILTMQANLYAEERGGFSDLPPRMFDAIVYKDRRIQRPDFRGDEKLGQFIDAFQLWRTILHAAYAHERKKVTADRGSKRREPNKHMHTLFCTLNDVWERAFDELPADGWNPRTDRADGPYFRFLGSLFSGLANRIDPKIAAEYPELARDFRLTPNAIRARFRNTGEAKLPALAKRLRGMAKSTKKK
jgi:hypothetical protein